MIKFFSLIGFFLATVTMALSQENYLLVGTYTGGKSEGIYVYKFNSGNGSFKEVSHIRASNPSFISVSPDERFVYAVHENGGNGQSGQVSAYAFDKSTGSLKHLNTQSTHGDHPCYVETDRTGRWVFAGNYSSGNFVVLPVNGDGSLGEAVTQMKHEGSGPDSIRQTAPHVHATRITPDNKWLLVPDLGTDKLMIYSFDASTGNLSPASPAFAKSQPGSGPRHLDFHPNGKYVYLIEELTGNVVTYAYDNGNLRLWQRLSSLPQGKPGFAGSADIHVSPDGKFLYASSRGDFNNIARFRLDKNGRANPVDFQPTMGAAPRNFNFDPSGKFLLVGNQGSDEIVIFKRHVKTGRLSDTGNRIAVGKPVCIKWIGLNN